MSPSATKSFTVLKRFSPSQGKKSITQGKHISSIQCVYVSRLTLIVFQSIWYMANHQNHLAKPFHLTDLFLYPLKTSENQRYIETSEMKWGLVLNFSLLAHLSLATNVITCARFRLKQMWRLTKAMAELKCEHWTKRWNWSSCTKLALRESWTHGLIAQSVRASERNLVVMVSSSTQANFL